MHYRDSLENLDVILTIRNIYRQVVTSLHVKFLIVNLFNLIHRARRFEKKGIFTGEKMTYFGLNEIFSAF